MSTRNLAAPLLVVALLLAVTPAGAEMHRAKPGQSSAAAPLFVPTPMLPQPTPTPTSTPTPTPQKLVAAITLADIGFANGIRFANLGGRREIFVKVPQGAPLSVTALILNFDDLSAHEARRTLEVLVNDRSTAAIALDGKGIGRSIRIPLGDTRPRDGYIKLDFAYSGAATQDRCIDVRYVGDSLTVRPSTAVEIEFDSGALHDVAAIAALMPRAVTVVLPGRPLSTQEFAAAVAVARSLKTTGRHAQFRSGLALAPPKLDADGRTRWTRGMVVIGTPDEVTGATTGSGRTAESVVPIPATGALSAVKLGGFPALLVSDAAPVRAARLIGSSALAATRGLSHASVGELSGPKLSGDRVTFDQLGLASPVADVYGRADLGAAIDTRALPPDTQLSRLALDVLVTPDGTGEKAVVSIFVNERLMTSEVAALGAPTRIDVALPDDLSGTLVNIRAVVQRRSRQGDCRFEPQGYPAQILGSSAVVLKPAGTPHDFSALATRWDAGMEIVLPAAASVRPERYLGLISDMVGDLSPETAPIAVTFDANAAPSKPFIAVSTQAPKGASPFVRFDKGRVTVTDRNGRSLLDLGGFTSGAVAQLVAANGYPGIWVKPFAADGALPNPPALHLDRGDVAFLDNTGTALAMSTARDTLIHIAYPDQMSWAAVAVRFRSWIIGSLWLFATIAFLFALQRMRRRQARTPGA